MARLKTNVRITSSDHFQDTRHIEFILGQDGPNHDPGDILTILPHQEDAAIARLLNLMDLDPDCQVRVELSEPCQGRACGFQVPHETLSLQRLVCLISRMLSVNVNSDAIYIFLLTGLDGPTKH